MSSPRPMTPLRSTPNQKAPFPIQLRSSSSLAYWQIGGATGSIGDPSGRSTERVALDVAQLETNVKGITNQVERFFQRGLTYASKRNYASARTISEGSMTMAIDGNITQSASTRTPVRVLNNLDWTKGLGLLEFLRTVGKVARVNVMLSRDR
jgi:tyrosyl-tRNA synthetase